MPSHKRPKNPNEHDIAAVQKGRGASIVMQFAAPLYDEMFDALVTNAISAYRARQIDAQGALVFLGKLDALLGFMEELESRVTVGEYAAANLNPPA